MPVEEAVVIDPGDTLVDLGPLDVAERDWEAVELQQGLAGTGATGTQRSIGVVGVALIVLGGRGRAWGTATTANQLTIPQLKLDRHAARCAATAALCPAIPDGVGTARAGCRS
jgi:hypothetical protein